MSFMDQLGRLEKIVTKPSAQAAPQQARPAYLDRLDQSKNEAAQTISGLFARLGEAFYQSHADDRETEFEPLLAQIRDGYEKIAEYEQQAGEVAARTRCPSCGAQLAEGSLFCNLCGTKLQEVPAAAGTAGQSLCPCCHAPIFADDVFCASCGTDLRGNPPKTEP